MANITDHVLKLQELTQQNLDILKAINDSFFTKQDHLSVNVGDSRYAMPSFLSLENKINSLLANFNNLVHAPETGEAFFNFDGDSRAIQVRSYTETPNSLVLDNVTEFHTEENDIFKDFMTPIPFIKVNVASLPNDITNVMVKKIIPISNDFKTRFQELISKEEITKSYPYKDLYKILDIFTENVDYIEYDTKMSLPIRQNIGHGTYVVEEIIRDEVDENLDNYLTLRIRNDLKDPTYSNNLKYRLFNETIEKMLVVGDELVTFEGNAKLQITKIQYESNTIEVKVLHGEYVNLIPTSKVTDPNPTNISSLSKLKFYSPIDFNNDKYVKIPLEEDRYIFVAVAALNDRMNVQSSWGSGLLVNTYNLTNSGTKFDQYYKSNVKNVGDILFEITSMMSNTLTDKTQEEYNKLTSFEPTLNMDNLLVTQINKHLDDSKAIQNIRALYAQKKELQAQKEEIQNEILAIQEILSTISFDDTTGMRTTYTAQLSSLSAQQNDINTSITKLINDISVSVNNSEVPIENAKYRIRGFIDYRNIIKEAFDNDTFINEDHIKGIRVQYRYKNSNQIQNQALTFGDEFVFSDWNNMDCFDRERISKYENGRYKFDISVDNSKANEPSFNQIDIPISQGETVDIRYKLVYDYGYPFVTVTSQWSQIYNVEFPDEYLKNVKILDIVEENNNDIENNRITNTLVDAGVTDHINDKITDQDITYWHKPENIASGFYTQERRIIPLKDKLFELTNELTFLKDEIFNLNADSLTVSIKHGDNISDLTPHQTKDIFVEGYGNISSDTASEGIYIKNDKGLVTTILNISIKNNSDHSVKLFSMFPGGRDVNINDLINYKFAKEQYQEPYNITEPKNIQGVWFEHPKYKEQCSHTTEETTYSIQGGNQFIYFRLTDPNTGEEYYKIGDQSSKEFLSMDKDYIKAPQQEISNTCAYLYPRLTHRFNLTIESNVIGSYLILSPQQEIIIPLVFEYFVEENKSISKTISFEIFPSLYKDPIPYICRVNAKYQNSLLDDMIMTNQQHINNVWNENPIKYNTIYK